MSQIKLLNIDDDQDQRDLIREVLEDRFGRGTVVSVGTGGEALAQDLAGFDLILSDYNLPDCTGMDLLGQIRSRCRTPVIMVTGENVSEIAAEAIQKGATDYVVKVGDYIFTIPLVVEKNLVVARLTRENDKLRSELQVALDDVRQTNQQLAESLEQVQQMAATDPLTGLYNRRHLAKVLEQVFAESKRYNTDLSAVMIDLDGYKQLNDSRGHQVGDDLLVMVGGVLRANMRRMDVAARYGGDEFVLLLPHAGSLDAGQTAARIRAHYTEQSRQLLSQAKGMTMSVGVASLHANQPASADGLIACADAALYAAKENGRDRIHIATANEHRLLAV